MLRQFTKQINMAQLGQELDDAGIIYTASYKGGVLQINSDSDPSAIINSHVAVETPLKSSKEEIDEIKARLTALEAK